MVETFRASLLTAVVLLLASAVPGQTPAPATEKPTAPGLIKLTGDDEKRAKELDEQIDKALKADRWDEAISRTGELLTLRSRVQGSKHFETVNAGWRLKGLRRIAHLPARDQLAYQEARSKMADGIALHAKGKYTQAQTPLQVALEIRRRLLTDDDPETADCYAALASSLRALGKHADAQRLYEKALDVARRLLGDNHPDTAADYNNLGLNLGAQGKYIDAQVLLEKGLEIRRRLLGDDSPSTATSYNNAADNLRNQGRYAAAQPLFEKALKIRRRMLTDNHPDTALSYNDVAVNLDDQGKYAQAQPLLEKALEIYRRLLTDDHPDTALAYNNLAYNLTSQRKIAEAEPLFEKALGIYRRLLTDDHPSTARSYNYLAYNLYAQGKYAAAQPLYEKALEIKRRLLGDDHPDTALSYNNVAYNLNLQGRYAAAQPMFEKSLEIKRRMLGDTHPLTAVSWNNLAINLNAQGKYEEARDQWNAAATSQDAARLQVAFAGLGRISSAKSARPALAALLARLGRPEEAWQSLEKDLGRGLLDELAARQDRRLTQGDRARLHELTNALERVDKLMEAATKVLDHGERAKRLDELKHERELASIALGEFQSKLFKDYGPIAGQVATLSEVQSALAPEAALVAWIDIPPAGPNAADPDGEHWGVVVRARGAPNWVAIQGTGTKGRWTPEDTELAGQVRAELTRRRVLEPRDWQRLVAKLRVRRLDPLQHALGATAEGLPPARLLIVLPSPAVAGIPLDVLLGDRTETASFAPSGTVFKYLRDQPRPDRHAALLALGDPVYRIADTGSVSQAIMAGRELTRNDTPARSDEEFAPLPGTRHEVEAIAQIFQSDNRPTTTLLGIDASEHKLDGLAVSGKLGQFGFIHLATHGVIDESISERSALILTQTGSRNSLDEAPHEKTAFDGKLSVREIQHSWALHAELVTLSACETALGRERGGEGFVGFTQALLMSGARSVCLSLWKVDDIATALLMQRFYANVVGRRPGLARPLPKSAALAEAKAWLRGLRREDVATLVASLSASEARSKGAEKRKEASPPLNISSAPSDERPYAHPHFWAAFVLVGDPD
jgi:CHAT domain-containing protein/tetratricopeptide (TPR) repeat protein